ncbi:peptidylprolyl isomerase [Pseudoalteromonas denitrificans]|uniref:peptidylprolyl isomerase n=1 Tax=Pseudoalteromonas denitrificans DSM 6059 TaxID=1123010 RepID=A0A1I1FLP0_9GAMM|nr:peptidylprolyl isomerase [Pseudoalteromonas denitrificans]SFB99906.1 Cyclophilin type peptidyl-prolyl cis-trans isomerase/CLD [Pseudoalteromonas denitrificans DSM 6059]
MKNRIRKITLPLFALSITTFSNNTLATIVEFQTSQGNFQVNLFDETTPKTVENFLHYVKNEKYSNVLVHRVASENSGGTIVQGGGYKNSGSYLTATTPHIETISSVTNEAVWSNVKGTIAMAKVGGFPNSATSEWFVNLHDNSKNGFGLDTQNEGFTVFGQVISGLENLEKIAELKQCSSMPMLECTESEENFVTILQTSVIDDDPASANTLSPVKNTLINQVTTPDTSSSSGGSLNWLMLLGISLISLRKKLN